MFAKFQRLARLRLGKLIAKSSLTSDPRQAQIDRLTLLGEDKDCSCPACLMRRIYENGIENGSIKNMLQLETAEKTNLH